MQENKQVLFAQHAMENIDFAQNIREHVDFAHLKENIAFAQHARQVINIFRSHNIQGKI